MEDDENSMSTIGFMFDASHSRIRKNVVVNEEISLQLSIIGEDPGHVQSGQYLWPAALYAARHISSNWTKLRRESILEMGAGCGLTGLTISKLEGVKRIVLTDYDPGCITILNENKELNIVGNFGAYDQSINPIVEIFQFSWGCSEIPFQHSGFGLIVGSDLLYCHEIVPLLLKSVNALLLDDTGVFVLVSSFNVGEDIERIFQESCDKLQMDVVEVEPLDVSSQKCRVQCIQKRQR